MPEENNNGAGPIDPPANNFDPVTGQRLTPEPEPQPEPAEPPLTNEELRRLRRNVLV